jgi:hypothetical protein
MVFRLLGSQMLLRTVLGVCLVLFFAADRGYAMQPPPPPLNIDGFVRMVEKADLVVLGTIMRAQETETTIGATLKVERLLKGRISGNRIIIEETFKAAPDRILRDRSGKTIVRKTAGPRAYHGKYKPGMRIVLLLEKNKGTDTYRPLGSGTYDKYLCEFLVEEKGIKTLYYNFAGDLMQYADSEEKFIGFIRKIVKPD